MGVVDLFMPCSAQLMRFGSHAKGNCTTQKPLCGNKGMTNIAFAALSSITVIVEHKALIPNTSKWRGSGWVLVNVVKSTQLGTMARALL